jgi:hypothetical protein
MPTLTQLKAERWWNEEIVTDEARWFGAEMARRTGRPLVAFGCKGNEFHLSGSHRSQAWLKNSRYCTNRTGTVQSGLTALQERHCAGIDWSPGSRAKMVEQCTRIYNAMRAGLLDEVRWFYGNVNGDHIVDGWNNILDRDTTSDSSHLDHWHAGCDRRAMNSRPFFEKLLEIALGDPLPGVVPTGDTMIVIAKDDKGKLWVCDGIWSRPAEPDQIGHIKHLAGSKAIGPLWNNGEIWNGWIPAFGVKTTELEPAGEVVPGVDQATLTAAFKAALLDPEVRSALVGISFEGSEQSERR